MGYLFSATLAIQGKTVRIRTVKGTLEDRRDPVWVCQEMMRVAQSGYLKTPTRIIESLPGVERSRYSGYSHHHWFCELTSDGIEFTFKHAQMHGYKRFHLTVGPDWSRNRLHHHWSEIFDSISQLYAVVNRWFREVNPKFVKLGMYWTDSFRCRENVLVEKGDVEANLVREAYEAQCILTALCPLPLRTSVINLLDSGYGPCS